MEEQLKMEEYRTLLEKMHVLCDRMPDAIFHYFDKNKYLYSLYFEAFNSIKGFCVLMGNGGLIPQAATVLRMALERTATIRVLELHKELLEEYKEHQRMRTRIVFKSDNEKKELIKEYFKEKMVDSYDKNNPLRFLEYGWFKSLNNEYGLNSLIELSKIQEQDDAIKGWKDELNQWVHGNILFMNFNILDDVNAPIKYGQPLILLAAKLMDHLVVDFHNENKFDFKFDGCNLFDSFRKAWEATRTIEIAMEGVKRE